MGDDPGLPGRRQGNQKDPSNWKVGGGAGESVLSGRKAAAGFEDGGRDHEPRNVGGLKKEGKAGSGFSPGTSGKTQRC